MIYVSKFGISQNFQEKPKKSQILPDVPKAQWDTTFPVTNPVHTWHTLKSCCGIPLCHLPCRTKLWPMQVKFENILTDGSVFNTTSIGMRVQPHYLCYPTAKYSMTPWEPAGMGKCLELMSVLTNVQNVWGQSLQGMLLVTSLSLSKLCQPQ